MIDWDESDDPQYDAYIRTFEVNGREYQNWVGFFISHSIPKIKKGGEDENGVALLGTHKYQNTASSDPDHFILPRDILCRTIPSDCKPRNKYGRITVSRSLNSISLSELYEHH